MKRSFKFTLALVTAQLLGACASYPSSPIPGVYAPVMERVDGEPIPFERIMLLVRAQLQQAYQQVGRIKAENSGNRAALGLNPQEGSGSLSGSVQVVSTGSGNILAVIPFSGYAGSLLSPNFGLSKGVTSLQSTSLAFGIKPKRSKASGSDAVVDWAQISQASSKDAHSSQGAEPSGFITQALIAAFEQIAMLSDPVGSEQVRVSTLVRELKLSFSFMVTRTNQWGLGVTLIPSAPDLDSLASAPLFGSKVDRIGVYKLDLTIPLITARTSDPKRILHSITNAKGEAVLIIDRPYTKGWYEKLVGVGEPEGVSKMTPDEVKALQEDVEAEFD